MPNCGLLCVYASPRRLCCSDKKEIKKEREGKAELRCRVIVALTATSFSAPPPRFLTSILAAMSSQDAPGFADASAEFNAIKKIDPWMTRLLLQAKRTIVVEAAPEGDEESDEETEPAAQAASDDEDLS